MGNEAIKEAIRSYLRLEEIFHGNYGEIDIDNSDYYDNGDIKCFAWKKLPNIDKFLKY